MGALIAFLLTHTSIALAALGALATLLGIGWGNLRGAKTERAKHDAERLAARTEADKIDQAVAGMTDAEVLKEQAKWSRPRS